MWKHQSMHTTLQHLRTLSRTPTRAQEAAGRAQEAEQALVALKDECSQAHMQLAAMQVCHAVTCAAAQGSRRNATSLTKLRDG